MIQLSPATSFIATETGRPLCVRLDGTLVKSDTFIDSLMVLTRRHPVALLRASRWALKDKVRFQAWVASVVTLDAKYLPYNQPLLSFLRDEHDSGRKLYLVPGADRGLANQVSAHLGIFDDVLAIDGSMDLTRKSKPVQLEERFAKGGFDYIGNAIPDLPRLQGAADAMLANPRLRLKLALRSQRIQARRTFLDRPPRIHSVAKALRVHQWAKNLLVFLPLLLAHAFHLATALAACAVFSCFCMLASSTYILNDLLDLESDRTHVSKRRRAFAAGDLPVPAGLAIAGSLAALSLIVGASSLPSRCFAFLLLYLVTTVAYSLKLKRVVLLDVMVLSGLYTVRMVAGSVATHNPISPWLAAFSIFFFLSLAMVKRFSELQNLHERGAHPTNARGYLLSDREQVRSFGTASAYASIVVFSLYLYGRDVAALYHHPARMWLMMPFMILWLSRIWLLASRGKLNEDPVVFALTDRMSISLGLGIALVAWSAL